MFSDAATTRDCVSLLRSCDAKVFKGKRNNTVTFAPPNLCTVKATTNVATGADDEVGVDQVVDEDQRDGEVED